MASLGRINAARACALGAVDGFLCGAAIGGLNEFYLSLLTQSDGGNVVVGNAIVDMRPLIAPTVGVITLSCALIFALVSYAVHRFWHKPTSLLILWQVIGISALALLSVIVYLQTFFAYLAGRNDAYLKSLPSATPFVCLAAVVIVSFIVGVTVESSAKLYTHS